jgi:hypothetical protein
LKAATASLDLGPDLTDSQLRGVARYCVGKSKPPEIGSPVYFLRTAASSKSRASTSPVIGAVRAVTAKWPAADWLFAKDGFLQEAERLTRDYRNPAAHTAILCEADFEDCSALVESSDGLLWRLLVAN